jgi:hypothetical protein
MKSASTEQPIDPVLRLRTFTAETINKEKWFRAPVKVELMDIGFSPVYEMEARKDDETSTCEFPKENATWRGAAPPTGPLRVQFTYEGRKFLRDLP